MLIPFVQLFLQCPLNDDSSEMENIYNYQREYAKSGKCEEEYVQLVEQKM